MKVHRVIKERVGIRIRIVTRNPTAILAQCFNSRAYCKYWQEYGVNFIISLGVLYWSAIRSRKETEN
jgi:hypothetical protein